MAYRNERYTFGGGASTTRHMNARTLEDSGRFFLPYRRPGMNVLDCGCGPGSITLGIAKAVAAGHVTGIDIQPGQVEVARSAARQDGMENVDFQVASIHGLPFGDEEFDAAFAHAVFEHLAEPHQALLELRRVIKRGGVLGIRSPDTGSLVFGPGDTVMNRDPVDLYDRVLRSNGGNPLVGRELRGLVNGAGFEVQTVTASCDAWTGESVREWGEYIRVGILGQEAGVARRAVELGFATRAQLDALIAACLEWESHPDAIALRTWVEVVATRP